MDYFKSNLTVKIDHYLPFVRHINTFRNMSLYKITPLLVAMFFSLSACSSEVVEKEYDPVEIVVFQDEHRIDVRVDGDLFTSYTYTDTLPALNRPVLYPVYTSRNSKVTRGYPVSPRAGERANYPNQIGLWLGHGDVNGVDFWNSGNPVAEEGSFGSIQHHAITSTSSGQQEGVVEVEKRWVSDEGAHLLTEQTRYVFRAHDRYRSIDCFMTFIAEEERVTIRGDSEGFIAFRAAEALELPLELSEGETILIVDENGQPRETTPGPDNRYGVFINSGNNRDLETHGLQANWLSLSAIINFEPATVAIFDHPDNPGSPPYWNVQSYGMFSSNPFGGHIYGDGGESQDLTLDPGESVSFRYRIVIEADLMLASDLDAYYQTFVQETN